MDLVEKLKSIGNSIQLFLAGQAPAPSDPPAPAALEVQDALQDGTPLTFNPDLAVGATVMSSTDMGTMPLADGEYILASGQPFTVSMGVISTLGEIPAAAMPALAELENTLAERLSETFKPKVTPEMITELETKLSKQTEIINDLYEAVVELSKAEPTREIINPTPKGSFNPDTIVEALKEIKKLKNK